MCLGIIIGRVDTHADNYVWPIKRRRRLEFPAIKSERYVQILGCEMRGERKWQPKFGREARAEITRAQKIKRDRETRPWNGGQPLPRRGRSEV